MPERTPLIPLTAAHWSALQGLPVTAHRPALRWYLHTPYATVLGLVHADAPVAVGGVLRFDGHAHIGGREGDHGRIIGVGHKHRPRWFDWGGGGWRNFQWLSGNVRAGINRDGDRAGGAAHAGEAAVATQPQSIECGFFVGADGRQVLHTGRDQDRISAADAHAAAGLDVLTMRFGHFQQAAARFHRHAQLARQKGDLGLRGIDRLGRGIDRAAKFDRARAGRHCTALIEK